MSVGSAVPPLMITYDAITPESAPVGPTILKLLPPKSEASSPAQIAVTIPAVGGIPDATARAIESGIDTRETVTPAFQFKDMVLNMTYLDYSNRQGLFVKANRIPISVVCLV